jgi:ribosome biogenesis GTPase A
MSTPSKVKTVPTKLSSSSSTPSKVKKVSSESSSSSSPVPPGGKQMKEVASTHAPPCTVFITGEVNSGKSSFINAFSGGFVANASKQRETFNPMW